MTRSEQLPCAFVTVFSRTSLFLESFWTNVEYFFKFHKTSQQNLQTWKWYFLPFNTFSFPFWYLILRMGLQIWWRFYFRRKKCPKMCLKINWSVKTPWHRPSMRVALSGLWVPDKNMLKLRQLCLRNVVPYWYLISRVLEFELLARQYFAGFYFRDFNRQLWKKGVKFRDLPVLDYIKVWTIKNFYTMELY